MILEQEKHTGMTSRAKCLQTHTYYPTYNLKQPPKRDVPVLRTEETELHRLPVAKAKCTQMPGTMLPSLRVAFGRVALHSQTEQCIWEATQTLYSHYSTTVSCLTLKRWPVLTAWLVNGGRVTKVWKYSCRSLPCSCASEWFLGLDLSSKQFQDSDYECKIWSKSVWLNLENSAAELKARFFNNNIPFFLM